MADERCRRRPAAERLRRGLGRLLARRAVLEAVEMALTKLVVEVVADQEALIAMFRTLGFEPEALLIVSLIIA